MDNKEIALAAVLVAVGIVAGFVAWTYIGPYIVPATPSGSQSAAA